MKRKYHRFKRVVKFTLNLICYEIQARELTTRAKLGLNMYYCRSGIANVSEKLSQRDWL